MAEALIFSVTHLGLYFLKFCPGETFVFPLGGSHLVFQKGPHQGPEMEDVAAYRCGAGGLTRPGPARTGRRQTAA